MFFYPGSELLHRLAPGICAYADDRGVSLSCAGVGELSCAVEAPELAEALLALQGSGCSWKTLTALVARGGDHLLALLEGHMATLGRHCALELVFSADGIEQAALTSPTPTFHLRPTPLDVGSEFVLSRFAYARREHASMFLESPEATCRVELKTSDAWSWLEALIRPCSLATLVAAGQHVLADFVQFLWHAAFLEPVEDDEPPPRAYWEFHDLLFHWNTRGGRVNAPQSGTFRFADRLPSPPAVKPRNVSSLLPLQDPTGSASARSLVGVIEERRSRREQGSTPIAIAQLSRLLYHTARVQQCIHAEPQELLLRPVPSAGAIHEIELYLAVRECLGLQPGLYRYEPQAHALELISAGSASLSGLIQEAGETWGSPETPPQVLLILASRFSRIAYKYEGIAYRLTLLNAGVMLHGLYLLATEMGLACTALGGGNSELFAAASGLHPLEETSVAEFALGSGPGSELRQERR